MTLRERVVNHIARTVSAGEAREANILLGLLIASFAGCANGFLEATTMQLSEFLCSRYNAATTIARRLSTMRLIFAVLVEWRVIESNPATDVDRPDIVDKSTDFNISVAVIESLVASQQALVEDVRGLMIHTERMILALIHLVAAGVFLAEIAGLVVRDLHADRIVAGRGGPRERPVRLSVEAVRAINTAVHAARQLPPAPDSSLFVTKRGFTVHTKMACEFVKRAIARAGLQGTGLTPAKLHRAAAKALIDQGYGWSAARNPSAYRRIPRTESRPTIDEMERAIKRDHPLEFA
jgi:site-specific recombinase XerD